MHICECVHIGGKKENMYNLLSGIPYAMRQRHGTCALKLRVITKKREVNKIKYIATTILASK